MSAASSSRALPTADRARLLAKSVLDHLKEAPDDAGVSARARTLRAMCGQLNALADEASRCCGTDCLGRRDQGVSLWVPQDRLTAEIARADRLAAENARMRVALGEIAETDGDEDDWMDQLVTDAAGRESRLRDLAADALRAAALAGR